ncbi:hypothetical protein CLOM_g8470, partial [Closterium sp. NIES-68]
MPTFRAPYRLSPTELTDMKKQIEYLLAKGLIRPSTLPYGAPVLFTPKPDGSLRMCIDYRALNKQTIKNNIRYHESMTCLISFGELRYFPNWICGPDTGRYEWRTDPSTKLLSELGTDHTSIWSCRSDSPTHRQLPRTLVSAQGVHVDPRKSKPYVRGRHPENVKELQQFLGFANYYNRFVPQYAKLAAPLTNLLKKNTPDKWEPKHQEAMEQLKQALTSAPVLILPDPERDYVIEADASDEAMGAVLMQEPGEWTATNRLPERCPEFVTSCDTCQRMKSSKQKGRTSQPLPVPEQPWQVVSLDFITGLPPTPAVMTRSLSSSTSSPNGTLHPDTHDSTHRRSSTTLRSIHHLTAWHSNHTYPRPRPQVHQHNLEGTYVSTRDPNSPCHPLTIRRQTDRPSASTKLLSKLLRAACKDEISKWDLHLPVLEFAYNNATHAATGQTTFFLCYGRHPLTPQKPTTSTTETRSKSSISSPRDSSDHPLHHTVPQYSSHQNRTEACACASTTELSTSRPSRTSTRFHESMIARPASGSHGIFKIRSAVQILADKNGGRLRSQNGLPNSVRIVRVSGDAVRTHHRTCNVPSRDESHPMPTLGRMRGGVPGRHPRHSRDMQQHVEHLRRVFEILRRERFYVKLSTCDFALEQVQFLGHIVRAQGNHVDPKKIKAVRTWKTPENVKELQQFLGFGNYYNRFVPQYANCRATHESPYKWEPKHQEARHLLQWDNDIAYRKASTKIWVPNYPPLRQLLLEEYRDILYAGHFGSNKTLTGIAKHYYWPHMADDVHKFVTSCTTFQRMKSSKQKKVGLLQPLPVPEQPWPVVSLDFITGLPATTSGHDAILVVIDKFSKMGHFIRTHTTARTEETAQLFVRYIISQHGIPTKLISDRDPKFTSKFWKELMSRLGTKFAMSSAYHPQTDGQTERLNQIVEQLIREACKDEISKWDLHLPVLEFAYNNATHAATGQMPFFLCYERHPLTPQQPAIPATVQPAHDFITTIHKLWDRTHKRLLDIQQQQKRQADCHRTDHTIT